MSKAPQKTTTMELAQLQQRYNSLLAKYKTAVVNYTTFLKEQANNPCIQYTEYSKNLNQRCIDHLWKRSGCGTGSQNPKADNEHVKSMTLNEFIYACYIFATTPVDMFREACYGTSTNYSKATAPDYKVNSAKLVAIPGYAFNGTSSIGSDINANTVESCRALCAKIDNCSGATFVSRRCMLKTGDSPIVAAGKDSYAIVSKEKELLLNINTLNNELLSVNQQILNIVKNSEPIYKQNKQESSVKNTELSKQYRQLMKERKEIEDLLANYDVLGSVGPGHDINTYRQYYSYWLWTIVLILILWFGGRLLIGSYPKTTSTVQYGGSLGMSAYYAVGVLVIFVILLNRTLLA